MEALKPGDPGVVGGYRLSGRLAQGRLGAVFVGKAKDGCPVAVRLVRPDLATDKKFVERFRKTVAAVREVDGLHLAHILDADADGTPPWLVTEYAPGLTLEAAVAQHGALPEESLRALGSALARALVAVHAAKVVHQGLAAGTVMLTADGPQITDLGIPALLGADATGGLPAPEQATGGTVGAPTDVFALAAVLCQAARVAPYGKGSAAELAQKVLRAGPELDELPDDLAPIVARCLARRPDARPTAAELVELFDGEDATGTGWLPTPLRAAVAEAVKAGTPAKKKSSSAKKATTPAKAAASAAPAAAAAKPVETAKPAPEPAKSKDDDKAEPTGKGKDAVEAAEPETVEVQVNVVVAKAGGKAADKTDGEPKDATEDESGGKDADEASPDAKPDLAKPAAAKSAVPAPRPAAKTAAKTAAKAAPEPAAAAEAAEPTVVVPKPLDQPQLVKPRAAEPAAPVPEADQPTKKAPAKKAAATAATAPTVVVAAPPAPTVPAPRTDAAATVIADPKPAAAAAAATTALPAAAPAVSPVAAPAAVPVELPVAVPVQAPRKREASNAVWYAVIVLVGLTSVGLAVYRLADSAWRDLQNPVMGMVLPGIALVCGLAGIAVLALAVSDRKKAAAAQAAQGLGGPSGP
ncbi:serine/threonine-protein kinase [Yinghuangia soli]|uniref:non-specific serine/threonine protein kinase n=1 Tax=Yinghuangia soli TaxID=2908204 RepID=A0AA41Q5L6_9ACTN|nr:serine/threonine-protein kinase [Yinghuangia soli]MCF2531983.1 protein kinase [Yinghuangia soli]